MSTTAERREFPGSDPAASDLERELELEAENERQIDFRRIWSAVWRSRFIILAIMVLAGAAGVASVMLATPIYRAKATVQIDQQTTRVLATEDVEQQLTGSEADRFLQTQTDILRSRMLARRVADSLALAADDSFLQSMAGRPGQPLTQDEGGQPRIERVMNVLQENMAVELPRGTRIAIIRFSSPDPALASRVVQSYVRNFVAANIQRRFQTSSNSVEFLQNQLQQAQQRLQTSERELINYARSAQLIDASGGASSATGENAGPRSLTTANLVRLNQAYAEARAGRVQAQQRWEQAAQTPLMSLPEVLSNPAIQDLARREAELSSTRRALGERLLPEHPLVLQANAELTETRSRMNALAASIRDSIQRQYQTAQRQEVGLEGQVRALTSANFEEQDRSIRYNILRREADTNRQLYESLLNRFKEVSAAAGVIPNNVAELDPAEEPRLPIWPQTSRVLGAALLIGIMLSLLFVFLRERFDDSLRSLEDVEGKLGVPLLGGIPKVMNGDPLDALNDVRSPMAEAYYAVRAAIELSFGSGVPRTILVTSGRPAEGKSTSSLALAQGFAQVGRSVLLIDADLRRPSQHRLLPDVSNEFGFANLLAQHKTVEEVVQRTHIPNLSFMSSGPLPPQSAQLLGSAALDEILGDLLSRFDIVIMDGPPVLALADGVQLAAVAGGTIFVVEAGAGHFGQSKAALRRLRRGNARIIGAVLTKFDPKALGYGYYYADYYVYGGDANPKPAGS